MTKTLGWRLNSVALLTLVVILASQADAAKRPAKTSEPSQAAIPGDQPKLIALLRSGAPPAEKALACKRLAMIGDYAAVPALAELLPSPELSSWARIALEVIPGPEADEALRAASGQLHGRLLVGVINSLGVRRDTQAVDGLISRLKDPDPQAAAAAAVALGRIGTEAAVTTLRKSLTIEPADVRSAVAEGCILSAERYRAEDRKADAIKLYDRIRAADLPQTRIREATRGAILARGAEGVPLLVEELQSPDKHHFALGLFVARELPGPEATRAIADELARATPQRQALLIAALADRGEPSVAAQIVKAAKSGPEQVRIYALRALKKVDETQSAPVLLEAALEDNAAISQAALAVIDAQQGTVLDGLVAERVITEQGPARKTLIELAGRRHIASASAALWKAVGESDPAICRAALTALGGTIEFAELPKLIAKLRGASSDESAAITAALQAAVRRMPDREACAGKLAAALDDSPVPEKCELLEVLEALGGPKSLAVVADAAKQSDKTVRDTAYRLLGKWMSADAAPVLLDLAKTARDEKHKVSAVRAYIRIARQFVLSQADRVAMCRTALEIADRAEDKRLVLEILLRYPSAEMQAIALEAAKSPELKDEALVVAEGIGRGAGGDTKELRRALAQAGQKPVKLEILSAEYGEGSHVKDVTAVLRKQARGYRLIFLPSASYNAAFGGDPAPDVVKHLKIRYRIDGKEGEAVLAENATVVLPMPK